MSTGSQTAENAIATKPVVADSGETALALTSSVRGPLAFLVNAAAFNHLWRVASGYARSALVPVQFRGKTEDCFIACQLAIRMNVDPFMLMQSMYVVHGRPGFEAKLAIALLNASGKIRGTIKTQFDGTADNYGARAWAIDSATGEKIEGPKVDWKMVKAEGWNKDKPLRDGKGVQKSKWNTMPDLMFVYRAASFLIRSNYPEVLMGMQTCEEIEDTTIDVKSAQPFRELVGTAEKPGTDPVSEESTPSDPTNDEGPLESNDTDEDSESTSQPDIEPESVTVAQWIEEAKSLDKLSALAEARRSIPQSISADGKQAIVNAIEMREAEIKGARGERSNKGQLFDGK